MDSSPTNASSSSASPASPEPPAPAVQQMHQGTLEMQRQLLQQRLAAHQSGGCMSPTDQMMTPVSKKLADHRKKVYSKAKPGSLASRFRALGDSGNGKKVPSAAALSMGVFGEPAPSSSSGESQ